MKKGLTPWLRLDNGESVTIPSLPEPKFDFGADSAQTNPLGNGAPGLWRPLRTPLFRNPLIADVMSDIGTFMQTVGAVDRRRLILFTEIWMVGSAMNKYMSVRDDRSHAHAENGTKPNADGGRLRTDPSPPNADRA